MISRPNRSHLWILSALFVLQSCGGDQTAPITPKDSQNTSNDTLNIQPCTFDQLMQCNDGNPCTQDRCSPNTFECRNLALPMNGALCDPQNICIEDAECQDGQCVETKEYTCQSLDPCKVQTCDPESGGCIFSSQSDDGTSCDDGNPCTTSDQCETGICVGGDPLDCTDDNPCTTDICDPVQGGCQNLDGSGAECDDHNPCTVDSCNTANGDCSHNATAMEGLSCETGNPCKGEGLCTEGVCAAPTIVTCNDDEFCTFDYCDPDTGDCVYDGTPKTGVLCNDNNPCTDKDRCNQGVCKPGPTKSCNDFNPCTQDVCYQVTACCSNSSLVMNNVPCDDGNPCTETGSCEFGFCTPGAAIENCCTENNDCNDGDPCTEDICHNHHCTFLTIPEAGCCSVAHVKTCTEAGITYQVCNPDSCGWDGNAYSCTGDDSSEATGLHPKACPAPSCQPQCGSKECGPDGCGGTCGSCDSDQVCGPAKLCVESLSLIIDFSDPTLRNTLDPNNDGMIEEDSEIFLSNGVQMVVTTEAEFTETGILGLAPFCFEGITLVLPPAIAWATEVHNIVVRGYNTSPQLNESGLPLGPEVLGLPGKVTMHYWADELFSQTEVSESSLPYWAEDGFQDLNFEAPATLRLLQLHFGENGTEYERISVDVQ